MALFGQSSLSMPDLPMSLGFLPASTVNHPRKRKYKGRTGKRYQTGNGQRENMRNARLAAKIRSTSTMNDDMLVRHRPKPATDGMDISKPSRQVRRAEVRRFAKDTATRFRKMNREKRYGVISIDWRIYNDEMLMPSVQAAG